MILVYYMEFDQLCQVLFVLEVTLYNRAGSSDLARFLYIIYMLIESQIDSQTRLRSLRTQSAVGGSRDLVGVQRWAGPDSDVLGRLVGFEPTTSRTTIVIRVH